MVQHYCRRIVVMCWQLRRVTENSIAILSLRYTYAINRIVVTCQLLRRVIENSKEILSLPYTYAINRIVVTRQLLPKPENSTKKQYSFLSLPYLVDVTQSSDFIVTVHLRYSRMVVMCQLLRSITFTKWMWFYNAFINPSGEVQFRMSVADIKMGNSTGMQNKEPVKSKYSKSKT